MNRKIVSLFFASSTTWYIKKKGVSTSSSFGVGMDWEKYELWEGGRDRTPEFETGEWDTPDP